ncbi:coenzyme F420-reducing hydrogenase beta subunit [Ruminiclostridium sufflavum DSM 19573]|uniref:Coenzyme F420-reducing hydrogenase beta subunit n=1 Tax=Ruminiclostridium sufflavum DSM 19573 TaxID=1121337 RepID=A0A318XY89_9FIRM|nr:Coenzyme F420 hydrogenase/dehydrogenase, beta subunit C-terminal domain [Ruminiclostridium sufflavum]PYG87803.1 coenzyme F420-reducing hydrogenase beta subunit [Ruminiclostridium sufflavum DSM 19573]
MPDFIKTDKKKSCFGCRACEQICPNRSVSMLEDEEGFIYPHVNESLCTGCGLCVRHCPQLKDVVFSGHSDTPKVFAAKLKNSEILLRSSSGGMFSAIAETVIENGGVVFGCAFDNNLTARHICADKKEALASLRGSKYVASDLNNTYIQALNYLKQGQRVFYTGTPCQIAGLKAFLGRDYENLLTADLICHGVPSQKLFSKYLDWLKVKLGGQIIAFDFRNKEKRGWGFCCKVETAAKARHLNAEFDPYYSAFLEAKTYRYSCYSCKYAKTAREGDLTIADYWGIEFFHPGFYSKKGVSLLLVNSLKGQKMFEALKDKADCIPSKLEYAVYNNVNLTGPSKMPSSRTAIYKEIDALDFGLYARKYLKPSNKLKAVIKTIIPQPFRLMLKKLLFKISFSRGKIN